MLNRRQFLGSAAAAAAVSGMTGASTAQAAVQKKEIDLVIIGAVSGALRPRTPPSTKG